MTPRRTVIFSYLCTPRVKFSLPKRFTSTIRKQNNYLKCACCNESQVNGLEAMLRYDKHYLSTAAVMTKKATSD